MSVASIRSSELFCNPSHPSSQLLTTEAGLRLKAGRAAVRTLLYSPRSQQLNEHNCSFGKLRKCWVRSCGVSEYRFVSQIDISNLQQARAALDEQLTAAMEPRLSDLLGDLPARVIDETRFLQTVDACFEGTIGVPFEQFKAPKWRCGASQHLEWSRQSHADAPAMEDSEDGPVLVALTDRELSLLDGVDQPSEDTCV